MINGASKATMADIPVKIPNASARYFGSITRTSPGSITRSKAPHIKFWANQ